MALTHKQEQFCREFLVDLNATQAAIRAGYSARTARQIAAENLSKPYIASRLNALIAERSARVELQADEVLREVKRLALFDIRKAVRWGDNEVSFIPSDVIDDDTAAAIQSVRARSTRTSTKDADVENTDFELKMTPKGPALRMAMEHLGLLDKREEGKDETHSIELVEVPLGKR